MLTAPYADWSVRCQNIARIFANAPKFRGMVLVLLVMRSDDLLA